MKHLMAIIGIGGMGTWHFEKVTECIDNITVKGAYDVRDEAIEKAREAGLHIYGSIDEILQDTEIDLITVATPNNFHKDIVISCLKAGKNVVCEKPVTMNAAELEEIMAVAKESGKLFSIHQNRRWDKDYCIIKKVLADKTLGEPYFIESRVQGSRGAMHGWRGFKENGGGMLLDWGVHLIDQMVNLVDSPVVEVGSHLISVCTPEVDDNIKIFLRFENGVSGMLEMATNCFVNHPRWHVSCTDGTVVVNNWACEGAMFQKKSDSELEWEDVIVYTEAGPTRTMAPRPKETIIETQLPEVTTDWGDYYKNIVDVIDNGADLIVKPEQALRVMKIIDLAFEAEAKKCAMSCKL